MLVHIEQEYVISVMVHSHIKPVLLITDYYISSDIMCGQRIINVQQHTLMTLLTTEDYSVIIGVVSILIIQTDYVTIVTTSHV